MAAIGHGAVARPLPGRKPAAQPQPARRPAPRRAPAKQGGVLGGVVWIGLLAVLLGGVVALNVAVLELNVRLDELARERAALRAESAALESQLSSAAASPQVEDAARKRLGLVPLDPEQMTYVQLRPGK
jgi:cell division protein FtsL